jgi:hypothetical protein
MFSTAESNYEELTYKWEVLEELENYIRLKRRRARLWRSLDGLRY